MLLALCAFPSTASAQAFEHLGARARGMGGAFVAVADDASASWWNPAGLPGTLILDGVVDLGALNSGAGRPIEQAGDAGEARTFLVAAAFPAGAFSYARLHQWRLDGASTARNGAGRQDGGHVPTAHSLLTHQFGISFVQSLGDAVVVGTTTRIVRGGVASAQQGAATAGDLFDAAAEAARSSVTRGDIDVGVRVRLARVRLGLAAKNLAAPEFTGADGSVWRLERRVRAGVAVVADADRAGRQVWVVAADADLLRDDHAPGSWRGLGAGIERWFAGGRLALRGGVEASTAGETRPAATGGLSVAVPGGVYLELSAKAGADERRGWGLGAHVMF